MISGLTDPCSANPGWINLNAFGSPAGTCSGLGGTFSDVRRAPCIGGIPNPGGTDAPTEGCGAFPNPFAFPFPIPVTRLSEPARASGIPLVGSIIGSRAEQLGHLDHQAHEDHGTVEHGIPDRVLQHLEPCAVQSAGQQRGRFDVRSDSEQLGTSAHHAVRLEVPLLGAEAESPPHPCQKRQGWGFFLPARSRLRAIREANLVRVPRIL